MFTARRQSGSSTRYLDLKVLLFGVGLLLLLLGIRLRIDWMVWVALAPLAAAFIIRYVGRKGGKEEEDGGPDSN